jgi:hypothetical protein
MSGMASAESDETIKKTDKEWMMAFYSESNRFALPKHDWCSCILHRLKTP